MKSLLIIRHAKSGWDPAIANDFDRPLNDRGNKNAREMAKRLTAKKIAVQLFISSPANRARTTAEIFIKEFKRPESDILFIPSLYHAAVPVFMQVVAGLDDAFSSAAVFSHNPGITTFVNTLTSFHIDNMPTCGIFALTADTDRWSEFFTARKDFLFFDYPKAGLHD